MPPSLTEQPHSLPTGAGRSLTHPDSLTTQGGYPAISPCPPPRPVLDPFPGLITVEDRNNFGEEPGCVWRGMTRSPQVLLTPELPKTFPKCLEWSQLDNTCTQIEVNSGSELWTRNQGRPGDGLARVSDRLLLPRCTWVPSTKMVLNKSWVGGWTQRVN